MDRDHLDLTPAPAAGALDVAVRAKLVAEIGAASNQGVATAADLPVADPVQAFTQAARASFVAPLESVAELSDLTAGTDSAKFFQGLAGAPATTDGNIALAASQLGSAVGMAPWMWLLHKGVSASLASSTGAEALSAVQRFGVSATSGLTYGLALTPTGSGDSDWLTHRLQNGAALTLSFGTLAGTTEMLAARGITNRIVAGALAGAPAGAVDTESRYAMGQSKNSNPLAAMGAYSFLGATFGALSPYGKIPDVQKAQRVSGLNFSPLADRAVTEQAPPRRVAPESMPAERVNVETSNIDSAAPNSAGEKSGYTGYFLNDQTARQIRGDLQIDGQAVPLRWTAPAEMHVTEKFGLKSGAGHDWSQSLRDKALDLRAIGYALDKTGVEALVVSVDGLSQRADGKYYHLTRSLADGRKANESMKVVEQAMAVHTAQTEGRSADIKPEDASRYIYTPLKPEEQFSLTFEPRFHETEITAKAEKHRSEPKPEVPFDNLPPRLQVVSAIKNTPADYLERTILTRTPEQRAGSYFEMSADKLKQSLFQAKWEHYDPKDSDGNSIIGGGARGYSATIAGGRLGMIPVSDIPADAALYLIDPKGTGKWSVSTVGAAEPHTEHVIMIVGPDEGGTKNMVWTFHPGEPIRPSMLDTTAISTILADTGLKADGLPADGVDRRIAITLEQLYRINASLPDGSKMTQAKVESADNIKPEVQSKPSSNPAVDAIPNPVDRVRFVQLIEALPAEYRNVYQKSLGQAVKNPKEVNRTTAVRGVLFEMSQLNRTLVQGLERVSYTAGETEPVSYKAYPAKTSDFSQAPQEIKSSPVQLDIPLQRDGSAPYAYEIKSSPRMLYGSDVTQRNQILKYQAAIDSGTISGATMEVSGRVSPDLVHWLNGKTVGDASAAPDVEVLYSMPLPCGADYTFILKRAAGNTGLRFSNDDKAYTAEDKRVIGGVYKAIQDRSIGDIISGAAVDNAPADLAAHFQEPMSISDLSIFNHYDSMRLQSMWGKLELKADSDRINVGNARSATSEYNTREYLDEAIRWYQEHLKQNPQTSKVKQTYLIDSEKGIQNVIDRAYERAQAVKVFEEQRASSPLEQVRQLERAALGYSARHEGISLDMEHIIMDATAEENKSASRRGRSYDNPERFMTVDKVLDYLNSQDRRSTDLQIFDPLVGETTSRNNLPAKEIVKTQTAVEADNLARARTRVAQMELRFEELKSKGDLDTAESAELKTLTSRHNGWNFQKAAIEKAETQLSDLARERKSLSGQNKPAEGQTKEAFIEQMKLRASQFDQQVADLNKQLQQRYREVVGGQGEWNKFARRVDEQENNIIKFMYAVKADGTIPLTEEVLRGEVTGRAAHSELAQGRNVYGAGELVFVKDARGKWILSEINNASGHFRPPGADTLVYVRNLVQQAGLDTSHAILNDALQRGTPLVDAHLMDSESSLK